MIITDIYGVREKGCVAENNNKNMVLNVHRNHKA